MSLFLLAALLGFPPPLDGAKVHVGGLLATMFDHEFDSPVDRNGMSIADARLSGLVTVPTGFEIFIQGNLVQQPVLLDLRLSWQADPALVFDAGYLKVPFSEEFILDARDLDFTDRSQAVTQLAPNRQVGAQVRGTPWTGWQYFVGIFNGNRAVDGNDDEGYLVAARVRSERKFAKGLWSLGVNGAYASDRALMHELVGPFAGRRLLGGVDTRVEYGIWLFSSEAVWARFSPDMGADIDAFGYQVSAGAQFTKIWATKARWDSFDPGPVGVARDLLILGVGPGDEVFSAWLDWVIPIDEPAGRQRLLFTLQAAW